jgi:hypothetical protein
VELTGAAQNVRLRATPPEGPTVTLVYEGTPVTVLTTNELISGVYWWVVRLEDGREGWLPDYVLRFTQYSVPP